MAATTSRHFTELSTILTEFCRGGQVENTNACEDVREKRSSGLGGLENANHGCLHTGVLPMRGLDDRSRMNREVHVRVCESAGGKFPCATRPCNS